MRPRIALVRRAFYAHFHNFPSIGVDCPARRIFLVGSWTSTCDLRYARTEPVQAPCIRNIFRIVCCCTIRYHAMLCGFIECMSVLVQPQPQKGLRAEALCTSEAMDSGSDMACHATACRAFPAASIHSMWRPRLVYHVYDYLSCVCVSTSKVRNYATPPRKP